MKKRLRILLMFCSLPALTLAVDVPAWGQSPALNWNGIWLAEGTLFSVAVTVQDNVIEVQENQSLGFTWTSQTGSISGNEATIRVGYAGATAQLLARLTGDGTAVVEAATCTPEFMVVCLLAKGQQARFIRQSSQ